MKNIFFTEGDPTGISYEIFDKSFPLIQAKVKKNNFILVSSQSNIESKFHSKFKKFEEIEELKYELQNSNKFGLYLFRTNSLSKKEEKKILLGKPSTSSGKVAYTSLIKAIELQKKIGGNIITLPLSKEWVIKSGAENFQGHTEVFAKEYNVKTFMLMSGLKLNVIPLTTHIPLNLVSKTLKNFPIDSLIQTIQKSEILKNSKIGFCGVNPHAGENGKIGKEELEIILPFIKKMKQKGIRVDGPIPADSLFIPEISKNYNLILACYHDQGLIPFKSLEGKNGINVTLGLDFIRVSPDHGTAFDIAGKGLADPTSLIQCIKVLTQ